jgi:acyl-CoA thioester hydrolase
MMREIMPPAPDGFRYHTAIPIRYRDMDTLGHVNNVVYLTYIEQARIEYFASLQLWDGNPNELGLILAKSTVEYLSPLSTADGTVHVWTRIARLGNKSFDMEHQLICERDNVAIQVAYGIIVMVAFDYHTNQTVAIPQTWRERIIEYEPALK